MALSTYSVIPMPQFEWNQGSMKYAICFFPLVGIFCGGILAGWYWLSSVLGFSGILFAALAVILPLAITGGIHMDGFMDTTDALSSHLPKERKLEILKDPHCGAFAVIWCAAYLLASFAIFYEIWAIGLVYVCCPVFVLSRALSALCAVTMPNAKKTGMLCAFTKDTEKSRATVFMVILALLAAAGMVLIFPVSGGLGTVLGFAAMYCYRAKVRKEFGGATGDTAGFFLQVCELSVFAGILIGGLI